jgi:glycosyltransferase involved in cell wall biosynthesis
LTQYRVLHVINGSGPGGAERQLTELIARSSLRHDRLELQDLPDGRVAMLRALRARIAERRPSVVVAWLDRSQIATALVAPAGIPLVASIRGIPRRGGTISTLSFRLAMRRFRHFVFNSEASSDALAEFLSGLPAPATVIPNGIEMTEPMPTGGQPPRIAFIGRDAPAKGLDVLLRALESFERGELSAILVGAGVPRAVDAAKPLLSIDVEAYDRMAAPWDELGPVDALVLPSRSEGSPNVVLEAFARGVPVVATTAGGTGELVADERAISVPVGDPEALAAGLRALLDDRPAAVDRAARARNYIQRQHAWPRVIGLWDQFLGSVGEESASE